MHNTNRHEKYLSDIKEIVKLTSHLFLFNHASTARSYYGSIVDRRSYKKNYKLKSLLLGMYRLTRAIIYDMIVINKSRNEKYKSPAYSEFIFVPSSSLQYVDNKISTRFHAVDELIEKNILTCALSMGFKNRKTENVILDSRVIFVERVLRNVDIIACYVKSLFRLQLYFLYAVRSERCKAEILQEAMEYIHTEYSSILLYKALKSHKFQNPKQINFSHFEFEFGRAISLGFKDAKRIGRAHGLIHNGKIQFKVTKYLSQSYPEFFPTSYEVEDTLGKQVFPNARVLKLKRKKIDIDFTCNRLHIICSLHTTFEELEIVIKKLSEFKALSIHYHPRMRDKYSIIKKLNLNENINHSPSKIGKLITGFESRYIMECIESGATYIPHFSDPERSEYLENSLPNCLGINV